MNDGVMPSAGEVRSRLERAWALLAERRWAEAGLAVAPLPETSRRVGAVARLTRNLTALQQHRPEVYQRLLQTDPLAAARRFRLHPSPSATLTRSERDPPEADHPSRVPDSRAHAEALLRQAEASQAHDQPLVLSGLGNGSLVTALGAERDVSEGRVVRAVYVVEPDAERALACLMVHDWSGNAGPLRDHAFHWLVGPNAAAELEPMLVEQDRLELPTVNIGEGAVRMAVGRSLARARARRKILSRQWREMIGAQYATFEARGLTVGLARKPRVLVIGGATDAAGRPVLADAEAALRRLGWRTRRVTAALPGERMTEYALLRAMVEAKPDLVLSVGRVLGRNAWPGVFPEALPFIVWITDHQDGETVDLASRDFVLSRPDTALPEGLRDPAVYRRHIVEVPATTRVPRRPELWECIGPDVMCIAPAAEFGVSPDAWRERFAGDPAASRAVQQLIGLDDAGGTLHDAVGLIRLVETSLGHNEQPEVMRVIRMTTPLHATLYRRQALRWMAAAASDLGLGFSLYGAGWDADPMLSGYARGPLPFGLERERLIRDSKINLHLNPGACLQPALLDGLVAGGFYLVRRPPGEGAVPHAVHYNAEAASLGLACDDERVDAWRRSGWLPREGPPLPRMAETTFSDASSLRRLLNRWLADAAGRRSVAEAQRESVAHRLSYTAVLRRALARVGRRLNAIPVDAIAVEPRVDVHQAA